MQRRRERWVCFPCRKVWRKPFAPIEGWPCNQDRAFHSFSCPGCKAPIVNMGYRFRPPRRDDRRAWERLWMDYRLRTKTADGKAEGLANGTVRAAERRWARRICYASSEGQRLLQAIAKKRLQ